MTAALEHILITHGHGDHWFGTGMLLERFPEVTVLSAPQSCLHAAACTYPGMKSAWRQAVEAKLYDYA